jgi:type IV fimbrial biogenesis protein FimT
MTRQRGFSLIDRTYMANQRVVASAEVFMTGMQMARAEAVKLNRRVEFILTDEVPIPASVGTANTSATGRNWIIRALATATEAVAFIEGKSGAEGGGSATGAGSQIALTGSVAAVTFDGFGMPVGLAATATFDFSNPSAGNCAGATPAGPIRCLQVRLNRGGQARLCDPATVAGDTRSCGI